MVKYLLMAMGLLFFTQSYAQTYKPTVPVDRLEALNSSIEKEIRQAAVKVSVPFTGGHGSGSYIKYKDINLVITAQHVTDGPIGSSYLVSYKHESHVAILIYADSVSDIAVLYVGNPFKIIKPMDFSPLKEVASVGTDIYYSGYPSNHSLMSFRGIVSGYENEKKARKRIILSTYGWFGCSGSVIYNKKGQQIGVLYGVDVEYRPNVQVQENMIWVAPINNLKIDKALEIFCREFPNRKPKACK